MKNFLCIKQSPRFPKMTELFDKLAITEKEVNSIRKANTYLKNNCPDIIMTEFFYGYGNNYSGVHISNLDMLFVTLQKYQCPAKVITFVDKSEQQFIEKLINLFPLAHYFVYPIKLQQLEEYLT
ncbi:MAG: hypothetical protein QM504_07175 [Pseudomonadota bacterium]